MTNPEKDLLAFPREAAVTAFGEGGEDFRQAVVDIVRRYAPGVTDAHVRVREKGKYLAVNVTFRATSREQLEAIYHDLQQDPRVVYRL